VAKATALSGALVVLRRGFQAGHLIQLVSQPAHFRGHVAIIGLPSPRPGRGRPGAELFRRCHGRDQNLTPQDDGRALISLMYRFLAGQLEARFEGYQQNTGLRRHTQMPASF
jgi:hypothetical protein